MPKTHLPAHMDSVRQKLRPKHHLLILKCYPRLPKNSAVEAKPNGSELSYMLYYASTRRSKLQKVGAFLERKTASDVYKSQSARVLVTLQIVSALLENKSVGAGSGFALIAPYVLRIVLEILQQTNDISLIEASTKTWDVFCQHQDQATLAADHEYRGLYEQVVGRYADFAHKQGNKKIGKSVVPVAVHDQLRLREAGLGAIESVLLSDSLASEDGRQMGVTMPAILSNMRGGDERYLEHLKSQSKRSQEDEKEKAMVRRQSMATVGARTIESADTDPRQAEGTTSDADEMAEEEVAVLALCCLRAVFSSEFRPLVRSATIAVLKYLATLSDESRTASPKKPDSNPHGAWATKIFEMCTAWTPVQDRFVLMVTAVETMVRLPLRESDLGQHLLYTALVDHVLRSDLNLIGLSVMDILLGLIQQILRILQLSGPPVPGRNSAAQMFTNDEAKAPASKQAAGGAYDTSIVSESRIRLTVRLKNCVADLATHVYYTDQIADMVAAILLRLKPNPTPTAQQNPIATAVAIEEPKTAVTEVASNVSLPARERSNSTSGFFSFETARQIALEAVRDILQVANSAQSLSSGGVAESRNKVPISIWEGTQWLLRDPSSTVRCVYVDALATWLNLETKREDFKIKEPSSNERKASSNGALAKRAVSNASQKVRGQSKKATSTFLQLLHLAAYENALEFAQTSDQDITVLHLLLSTLVRKLGVNSIQGGLPMVFALQDDLSKAKSPEAQVRIGSLVHGYFWTLTEVFDFDMSTVGREIVGEITRRKQHQLWLQGVTVPPSTINRITPSTFDLTVDQAIIQKVGLRPFLDRQALVDCIAESYTTTIISPPTSPPGSPARSPGRAFATPSLDHRTSSYLATKPTTPMPLVLPEKFKSSMLESWTKESCLAAIAAAAPKSASLSDSQSSPSRALATGSQRNLLAAANISPHRASSLTAKNNSGFPLVPGNHRQQAFGGDNHRLSSQSPQRQGSTSGSTNNDAVGGQASSSTGAKGTLRVDDLKRVLAGDGGVITTGIMGKVTDSHRRDSRDSESLVDVDENEFGSEAGSFVASFYTQSEQTQQQAQTQGQGQSHSISEPTAAAPVIPETVPEDATVVISSEMTGPSGSVVPDAAPALNLPSHTLTDGHLLRGSAAGETEGHVTVTSNANPDPNGSLLSSGTGAEIVAKSTSSRGGSRPPTRKDFKALLAGVGGYEEVPEGTAVTDASVGNAGGDEFWNQAQSQRKFRGGGRPPY